MKIVSIVGARPQFIKAAVVSRVLRRTTGIQEVIIHTGQHFDDNMNRVFFDELMIPTPDIQLACGGGSHGEMTGRMLEEIERALVELKPHWVVVYGDTNSTLAGAIASVKLGVPLAHVESGLRSFDRRMPEEINRVLTDHSADLLFAPTDTAVRNLQREGIAGERIRNVGDVMYDAALHYSASGHPTERVRRLMDELKDGFYLATVHRPENVDVPTNLSRIVDELNLVSSEVPVVLPIHPRTRKNLSNPVNSNLKVIEPVGYFDMMTLLERCKGVFTDSGGLQKEAYFHQKSCIVLKSTTEWVELVEKGFNLLVDPLKEHLLPLSRRFFNQRRDYSARLFGDGHAGERMVEELVKRE
jgi:UDP-GlcNAc3NAcA epimerase